MSGESNEVEKGYKKEFKSNAGTYKTCFVPECQNTTARTPTKVFLSVPTCTAKRKLWFDAIGHPERKKAKSTYCCEDHFDLRTDLENYLPWLLTGANKKLRDHVVPRALVQWFTNLERVSTPILSNAEEGVSLVTNFDTSIPLEETSSLLSSQNGVGVDVDQTITNCYIEKENAYTDTSDLIKVYTKCIQIEPIKGISVGIQCDMKDITEPSINPVPDVLTSALKRLTVSEDLNETIDSIPSNILDTDSSYEPSKEECTSTSGDRKLQLELLKENIFEKHTKLLIQADPLAFLGVPKDCMFVLDLLSSEFGISASWAGKIFSKNVHIIAKFLEQFIVWPSKRDIQLNLPIPFRYRYANVQSIIDCFEIEIEKPSNAMNQSMSWSQYKGCNTYKGFISVSGDGLINFVSDGVGGRCSDISIVENCGYLDVLTPRCSVMADRGFKGLDTLLQEKNCNLIRPPSVSKDVKCSKDEVKLTKQIASLRIHVERVINRIRNFQLLDIHSRVDNHLLPHLDSMVKIACGLVNLQTTIIKQTEV
ncbi:hypothetical protein QAD02_005639 [Eretmocerus hayati]|uniref:Uncharacterized protein n=1 Tax=Eretmocerus hayati TaxID=131215 RepID=A0ACC2NTB8_9HYME|nr:hypothetical protein QAD02_005639 [Eretmocerus hayati]